MEQKKLTQGDLVSMFLRSNLQQASFNFERIHGLGFCYDMIPAIKRLYPLKEDQVAALKRHLVFFNTTPAVCGPVLGVTAAMEEARANGAAIDDGAINGIKVGLMGPLAGVGDPWCGEPCARLPPRSAPRWRSPEIFLARYFSSLFSTQYVWP